MTETKIIYKINNVVVGEQIYSNFEEIIFPFSNTTVTKKFFNHKNFKWLVKDVEEKNENLYIIHLIERDEKEEYLDILMKKNNVILNNIERGKFIEVDFGYIHEVKNRKNDFINNLNKYHDYLQNGEIYKRRLCIVLSKNVNSMQVLPLTSKGNEKNFLISEKSLFGLKSYQQPTYIIPNMICTVSFSRVLPPEIFCQKKGIYRDIRFIKRVRGHELKKIEKEIVKTFQIEFIQKKLNYLEDEKEQIKQKRDRLEKENEILYEMLKEEMKVNDEEGEIILKEIIKKTLEERKKLLD